MGNQKRKVERVKQQQRARSILIGLVLAMAVIAVLVVLLWSPGGDPPTTTGPNSAQAFAGGVPTLVYADFAEKQDLHRMDLDTKSDSITGELPFSGNTEAAFGSTWMFIEVVEEGDAGSEPVVYAFDPTTPAQHRLGIGIDPRWSPDGTKLAWSEAVDPSACGEGGCRGDLDIVVTDVATGTSETLVDEGRNSVLDWSGDRLIVKNTSGPEPVLRSVSLEGEVIDLPLRPVDYWGASPDGRFIVESSRSGVSRFYGVQDGEITEPGADIGIPEGSRLGTGAWSPDSSRIGAFALGDSGLEYVTFTPSEPEPVTLASGGESSTGPTLWSPDNDRVVFQRFNGTELEAVDCLVEDPGSCEVVVSWTRGIALLRIE